MNTIAVTLGVLGGLGVLFIVLGLRGRPHLFTQRGRRPVSARPRLSPERALLIAGTGLVVLVMTRWPVITAAAGATVWWLTRGETRTTSSQIEKTEALATWAEMLRDATGTPRGIEGVIVTTTDTAPLPIRPAVTRFADRLSYSPIGDLLPSLADELDDPNGDLIVASLGLAASSGGRDIRSVLDDLAAAARSEARMRRRLEVSRQRPRSEMRQVITIVVVVVLLLSLTSRSYLEPYNSVGGQLILGIAAALWIVGFVAMSRLGRVPPVQRFLIRRDLP